jgi:hypothetical protein
MGISRLTLPTGEWIDVKDKQKVRDEADVNSYSNEGISAEGNRYNIVRHRAATAAVRISNWSVTNLDDGKPIRWPGPAASFKDRVAIVESLYEEQGDAISEAISKHLKELADADLAKKNATQTGEAVSEPSSPSVN